MPYPPLPIFKVLKIVRDARSTRNADRQLLDALALRCDPKKNYKSWPSYALLAKDTGCNQYTLKKAAARLEKADYIRRTLRRTHSNLWYLNMPKLAAEAEANRAADKAEKLAKTGADPDEFKGYEPGDDDYTTKTVARPGSIPQDDDDEGYYDPSYSRTEEDDSI